MPGKWSTLEVVCHICDCEQFFADRMKRTVAVDRPLLVGADGWRYPEPVQYHQRDLAEELELVALTRCQMARILRLVPTEAWGRTAVHTETGLVTLRQLLLNAVNHLAHHLRFVAENHRSDFTDGFRTAGNGSSAAAARASSADRRMRVAGIGRPAEVAYSANRTLSMSISTVSCPGRTKR